jgi:hypothetical protein
MKSENLSQKQKEPDGTNRPAEEHSNKAQPPIPPSSASGVSKVQPPPSPHSYAITCDKKRDVWDWIKFAAEIVGIGVVLVYTSIAALQWCEMKKTNKLTEQAHFQRPVQAGSTSLCLAGPGDTIRLRRTRPFWNLCWTSWHAIRISKLWEVPRY